MRIAINAADPRELKEQDGFGQEVVSRLVKSLPDAEFLWIGDAGWQLPFQLRKQKADIYIGLNAEGSATSNVPQVLIAGGTGSAGSIIDKALFASVLRRATTIITPSLYNKEQLAAQYKLPLDNIEVIPPAPPDNGEPLSWEKREEIKEQYAGGNEYFLFTGTLKPENNIGILLRAFSVFKKWQKSSMKLVLAGSIPPKHEKELDELASYRFRADLVFLDQLAPEEMTKLLLGAYGFIYPATHSNSGRILLHAMAAGLPVICAAGSALEEVGGTAPLYVNPLDSREIGDQMIRLYKDETFRTRLINAGKERIKHYKQQAETDTLNTLIRAAVAV